MKRSINWKRVAVIAVLALGGVAVLSQGQLVRRQWETSRHNNVQTSLTNATVETRQAGAAHCARCHSDQGFQAWLKQLAKGDPGNIKGPDGKDATVEYLTSLGLTKEKAQPVTCTTCHDEDGDLRVINDTFMLPSGFAATGVGEGALCMTCHNTRNGRVTWNVEDKKSFGGPHHSSQADLILGKNFFFINDTGDNTSPHASFTGGSCTTCHMSLNEDESHTFAAPKNACAECHGPKITPDSVQRPTRHLMNLVRAGVQTKILAIKDQVKVIRFYDAQAGRYTDNYALDGKTIQSVTDIDTAGGQIIIKFKTTDGRELISPLGEFRDGPAPAGKQLISTADPVVRAAWNFLMIKFDGSLGVHNPSFVRNTLLTTANALK